MSFNRTPAQNIDALTFMQTAVFINALRNLVNAVVEKQIDVANREAQLEDLIGFFNVVDDLSKQAHEIVTATLRSTLEDLEAHQAHACGGYLNELTEKLDSVQELIDEMKLTLSAYNGILTSTQTIQDMMDAISVTDIAKIDKGLDLAFSDCHEIRWELQNIITISVRNLQEALAKAMEETSVVEAQAEEPTPAVEETVAPQAPVAAVKKPAPKIAAAKPRFFSKSANQEVSHAHLTDAAMAEFYQRISKR